jgi:predicted RNA-binding protein with TRAM domain
MAYDDDEDEGYDKPVEEGKTYTVKVEDLGSKGDGIARVEGFVVFVPETEVGETVRVEVNSVGRKFAFAEVVDRDVDESELEIEEEEDDRYDKDEVEEDEDDLEPDETLGEPDSPDEWDGPGGEDAAMEEPEEPVEDSEDEEADDEDRYDKDEVEEDEDDLEEEDLDAPATEEELENDLGVDDEHMRRPDEL